MGKDSTDFEQFMKLRQEVAQAYVTGDPAPLGRIVTKVDPATFFGPIGPPQQGAAQVWETNERAAKQFKPGGETHIEVLHAQSSGDLAYWVGIQHARVYLGDSPQVVPMKLRVTELFRREDGAWKMIHRHADQMSE